MTINPQYAERDTDFFRRHERSLGKQKLGESGAFQQQTVSVVEASYEVSLEIAKQKKPHTIGETLIKPCARKIVKRVLGEDQLGSKSGFQKRVKEVAPNAKGIHCMIHHFALASKTLPDELCKILEAVVKCVNFVKALDLNSCFFQNLCRDMDSEHEALLFYSKVRWISKGNVVNRVFELRGELKLCLEVQGKDDLLSHFNEVLWEPHLAYLADIFELLNRLNLKLQGKDRNVFHLMDCLRAFLAKLQNWQRKIIAGNVAMFENLSTVLDENEDHLLDP
ncbi:SCAN domain-containing protein 3-like [Homarus americanus]|uniref:SCAN domain-containing protein 3-like n=1 Tax=Homarus americanus TaxID=6706 RepID=UPI001C481588|nr:SCAN domain-containing protein 3-like [Homarus americanus]